MFFPLYKNDGVARVALSPQQQAAVISYRAKLESGAYKLIEQKCLRHNLHPEQDTLLAQKDRYGLPVDNYICSKCGVVRSSPFLDPASTTLFYQNEYRSIYNAPTAVAEEYLDAQKRGQVLVQLLLGQAPASKEGHDVFEVGCSSGGILSAFAAAGFSCAGCDFDQNYLAYGREQGLDLQFGEHQKILADNSIDILILSHVLEHFADPVAELQQISRKVKAGGYLLIEVPGIFFIDKIYSDPLLYLQNAHVFNYYQESLALLFDGLGLKVIYGDQSCKFVLQKPANWQAAKTAGIFDSSLSKYPATIKYYFIKKYLWHRFRSHKLGCQ